MSVPLYNNNFNLSAGFASHIIVLPAGNYYLEAISITLSSIIALAAGNVAMTAVLESVTFNPVYITVPAAAVAPAGLLAPVNVTVFYTPKLICPRGDSLIFYLINNGNLASVIGSLNLYGSNLP